MTPRNTATNIPLNPMIPTLDDSDNNSELDFTDEDEHVEQNEHEDEVVGLNNIPNVQSTTPQYRKHSKRKSYQTEAIEIERKKIKLFEERLKTKKNADSDEDYHFLMSLLPSFKKMDSLKKMKVRMEVLSIITKTLESEEMTPSRSSSASGYSDYTQQPQLLYNKNYEKSSVVQDCQYSYTNL